MSDEMRRELNVVLKGKSNGSESVGKSYQEQISRLELIINWN
jgi:hypothetical protein